MKYYVEDSLDNFEAWSGGKDTLDTLREKGDVDSVESFIEEIQGADCSEWSETTVNDFLWFERDTIAQHLGYSDWEEYEYGEQEHEEYFENVVFEPEAPKEIYDEIAGLKEEMIEIMED